MKNNDCHWMKDMDGIPICRLNVLPCERVSEILCDYKQITEINKKWLKSREDHDGAYTSADAWGDVREVLDEHDN